MIILNAFATAQTTVYEYDLRVSGNSVGTLKVSKEIQGSQKKYTSDNESVIHLFGETTIRTHKETVNENGQMISSLNQVWKDGRLYDETKVDKYEAGYSVSRNGNTSTIDHAVTYSSIQLYFHIPASINEVFSETEGVSKNIISTGNNTFQVSDIGNHTNNYTYENGVLQEAIINHTYIDVLIQLKK